MAWSSFKIPFIPVRIRRSERNGWTWTARLGKAFSFGGRIGRRK